MANRQQQTENQQPRNKNQGKQRGPQAKMCTLCGRKPAKKEEDLCYGCDPLFGLDVKCTLAENGFEIIVQTYQTNRNRKKRQMDIAFQYQVSGKNSIFVKIKSEPFVDGNIGLAIIFVGKSPKERTISVSLIGFVCDVEEVTIPAIKPPIQPKMIDPDEAKTPWQNFVEALKGARL